MNHTTSLLHKTLDDMRTLMRVALGEEPADLVVSNADLVNVYTGEIQKNMGIAVKGRWIAGVSADVRDAVGPATRVLAASGRTLVPGLIDGHTHLAWICTAAEFIPFAAAAGVTTVVTETLEPFPMAGVAGVLDFIESFQGQPIRILATAPAMVSISSAARGISPEDINLLMERDDILGLGESYICWRSWIFLAIKPQLCSKSLPQCGQMGGLSFEEISDLDGRKIITGIKMNPSVWQEICSSYITLYSHESYWFTSTKM